MCTIIPPDCPADVCGCLPGAATCASDQLTTCNADGMSTSTSSCALGCSDAGLSCKAFTPSNGLGPILAEAGAEPDVAIRSGSTIDTDTCAIAASNGTQILIGSIVVQTAAPMICAFAAHDFTIADVTVTGNAALALVAADDLAINGIVDASASGSAAGPGAQAPGTACDGGSANEVKCGSNGVPAQPCSGGPGGGGNALAGGSGGTDSLISTSVFAGGPGHSSGGSPTSGFSPLVGGCSGGDSMNTLITPAGVAPGGAGGGAVQLVSGATVELGGIVHVGGGGGSGSGEFLYGGGGAGGNIVIETPTLTLGAAGGFAANGGGGGGCQSAGDDATFDDTVAAGGDSGAGCSGSGYSLVGGSGGTAALAPGGGGQDSRMPLPAVDFFGGGGGSVGRARIATRDGTFASM